MEQCSICLDNIDSTGPTLACGHRFHASCLARLAGANGTTPTRRGALTACPNCRVVSRVALTPVATFGVGDRVDALFKVIVDPVAPTLHAKISMRSRKRAPPPVSRVHTRVDGAWQKVNGRWSSRMFPGREFDDLDAYRAAKKQREERRAAYADQLERW